MTKFTVKEDIVHDVGTICRDDEEIVSIIYICRAKEICDLLNEFCEEKQELKEYCKELLEYINAPVKHRKSLIIKKELIE